MNYFETVTAPTCADYVNPPTALKWTVFPSVSDEVLVTTSSLILAIENALKFLRTSYDEVLKSQISTITTTAKIVMDVYTEKTHKDLIASVQRKLNNTDVERLAELIVKAERDLRLVSSLAEPTVLVDLNGAKNLDRIYNTYVLDQSVGS